MPQTSAPQPEAPPQDQPAAPAITAEEAAKWLPAALQRPPIFDLLQATPAGRRQLQLLRVRSARGATDSEVAQFLELCAQYMLDWNAHEAWCAVTNPDDPAKRRVLLMVGRNGLRKIAQRQDMDFDTDVVRERDTFIVKRLPDRTREITHIYGTSEGRDGDRPDSMSAEEWERGKIRSAWCETYDLTTGRQRGFFEAVLEEYMPKSEKKREYSPWGAQVSVMLMAAAERTSLSQATPLGGIVAVGELDALEERASGGELTAGTDDGTAGEADVDLPETVREVIARAREVGHVGLSNEQTAAVAISGQTPTVVSEWIARAHAELDKMEPAAKGTIDAEAEEVDPDEEDNAGAREEGQTVAMAPPTAEEQAAADELGVAIVSDDFLGDGAPRRAEPQPEVSPEEEDRRRALRERASDLLNEAEALRHEGNVRQAEEAEDEAEKIMREVGEEPNPEQESFGL
jgi:hypothetical protein